MGLIPRGWVLHRCIDDALELSFGVKVGHSLNVASWELFFAARFKLNDFVEKKVAKKSFRQSVNKCWVSQLRTWARNSGRWATDRISNSSKPKTPKVIKVLELRSQYFVGDVLLIGCHDLTNNSFWGHGGSSSGSTSDYGSRGSDFDSRKGLAFFISS